MRDIKKGQKYKNIKTGNIYQIIGFGIDVTENRDEKCIIYHSTDNTETIYIRSFEEFVKKFILFRGKI